MYIGKSVVVQHRVATGHARLKSVTGVRQHLPVPTELQTDDAIVIGERFNDEGEPYLTVVYKKDDSPLNYVELQSGFAALFDVPHKDSREAEGGLFWTHPSAEPSLPSEADLDAVAEEATAKEATSGESRTVDQSQGSLGQGAEPPKPRIVKGSKAGK